MKTLRLHHSRLRLLIAALAFYHAGGAPVGAAVLGLWRFDEGSGDVIDGSGNGNTGSFVGPNIDRAASKPGFGSALNVTNDYTNPSYMQVPGNYSLQVGLTAGQPWSFTAWAYENSDGFGFFKSTYGIIALQNKTVPQNGTYYGLALQSGANGDGQMYLWHGENTAWQIGTSQAPVLDAWTHYAYVYDGSDFVLYINGAEKFRQTVGSQNVLYTGYDGGLQVGGSNWFDVSRNWDGELDDVAIFNQALTPTQIATVMTGNFTSFIAPLPQPSPVEWKTTGFGDWNTRANWTPLVAPNANYVTVKFGNQTLAPTTVVSDSAVTVNGVEFNHTMPYAIAGAGSLTIDAASGNGHISVTNAGAAVTEEFQLPVKLNANTDVSADAGTTLEFDNQLQLNGKTFNISGAGRVNINNDGTAGTPGSVVNSGDLGGVGTIKGNLVNNAGAKLAVDIAGTGLYDSQGLTVTGSATLSGTLNISLLNGFTPTNGNTFTVLTAGSITTAGLALGGSSAGFSFSVVGGANLVLTYSTGVAGDYNGDGHVDGADFIIWQRTLGSTTNLAADGNHNGTIDAGDLTVWKTHFGSVTPASAAVPEPSALISATCLAAVSLVSRRRSRSSRITVEATSAAASARSATWHSHWPRSARFALLASFVVASLDGSTATATILTFDGQYGGALAVPGAYAPFVDGYSMPDEYGDRVTGLTQSNIPSNDFGGTDWYNFTYGNSGEGFTPNVVVGYPASSTGTFPPFRYWSTYGGLTNVLYPDSGDSGPSSWYLTLTADAGVNVNLMSLQLDRYSGTGSGTVNVSVYQGSDPNNLGTQLYTSGAVSVTSGTPSTISPNVSANSLTLVYGFQTTDANYNWGLDNIRFSQTAGSIPTTATWGLTGSGRWSKPGNWTPDFTPILLPNGNTQTAVFGNSTTGPSTVVLDSDVSVKKIQFNHTQPYTIAGTGTLTLDADAGSASIEVLNAGSSATEQIAAHTKLADNTTVSIAAGMTLEINNRLDLGTFNLTKSGAGTLRINNAVSSSGGTVSALAGLVAGSGSLAGSLSNAGAIVAPGNSPGVLTIQGDYTQSAGTLQIELAGTDRGATYDVLKVGGNAKLSGGALEVMLVNGFKPSPGSVFDIMDFRSLKGSFSQLKLPAGIAWDTSHLLLDGTLAVSAVPEPGAMALAAIVAIARLRIRSVEYRRRQNPLDFD